MIDLALACLATWLFVGLKSFQQRNVAFDHYTWILPTSVGMSFCEFYVIAYIAVDGFSFFKALCLGLSAGTGSLLSTLLHGHLLGGANGKRKLGGVSSGMLAQGVTEARNGEDQAAARDCAPRSEGFANTEAQLAALFRSKHRGRD